MWFRPPKDPPPKMQMPGSAFPGNMFELSYVAAFATWFRKDRRRRGPGLLWRIEHALRRLLGVPPRAPRAAPSREALGGVPEGGVPEGGSPGDGSTEPGPPGADAGESGRLESGPPEGTPPSAARASVSPWRPGSPSP